MANRYPLIIDVSDGNKIKELPADDNLYLRNNSIEEVQDINALGTINAAAITIAGNPLVAQTFTDLTDVPNTFFQQGGKFVKVRANETGLEFVDLAGLGNVTVQNLTVNGGNIFPATDLQHQVGKSDKRFWKMHAESFLGNLRGFDGTLVFDAATNRIPYAAIFGAPTALSELTNDTGFLNAEGVNEAIGEALSAGSFNVDIVGSLFGDDSTLLVDGVNSRINTHRLTQVGATDGQALVWSDSNQRWEPGAAVGTGGLEGLTVTQDGARTNVGKNLTEDNNSITSQLYVQTNQIGLQTILNPDGANNNSTGSVNVTNDAVEISISEESIGGNSTVGLLIAGTGLELFQSDGVTTSIVTVNGSNITTAGTVTAGNIVADGLEFTGVGVVTVESGSNLVLNAANGAGNIVASGSRITNIADPLDLQDAATKSYVDAVFLGGGVAFFEGDMKGSVFADDSTLLVDGVAGVLKGNVEVDSTWTITTGSKTYTFYNDPEGPITQLQIPGGIIGPSQTGFTSAEGHGIGIDTFNTPYSVDIGNLSGGNIIRIEDGVGLSAVIARTYGNFTIQSNGEGGNQWQFTDKGITYPGDITQSYQDNTSCPALADTVIYSTAGPYKHAVRLFVMVEGEADIPGPVPWDTQACDIVAVRGYVDDTVHVSVYGLTYSSATPLATFDGQWNATTNSVEITCRPVSATKSVVASVHAFEITSND